jgi:hypothetical protein
MIVRRVFPARVPLTAIALLALGAAALGACGDDDGGSSPFSKTSTAGESTADATTAAATSNGGSQTTATKASGSSTQKATATEKAGATAALKVGSSATIKGAPDAGTVTMTITDIMSPADSLLAPGLTVDPGMQLWAVKAKVDVKDGAQDAIADFTVYTAKGSYTWTGTASKNDIGYDFKQGSSSEGYIAFQVPQGETVTKLLVQFSVYQGYDMVFQ